MSIFNRLLKFSKRQKFVAAVVALSLGLFFSEFLSGLHFIAFALVLSLLTNVLLFLILRLDVRRTFFYPLFILPFLYTLAFSLFFLLVPSRLLSQFIITGLYAFGLYSLFLAQNIFAVSALRTINLLRSARIVSFVVSIVVMFFLVNITFSFRLEFFMLPLVIFVLVFLLNFQSLWVYALDRDLLPTVFSYSFFCALCIMQLALVLTIWPVTAAIYSLFITGIFYMYSGLSHAWMEKRLFKGVLWEYIWVGFLSIMFLIIFSKWGI